VVAGLVFFYAAFTCRQDGRTLSGPSYVTNMDRSSLAIVQLHNRTLPAVFIATGVAIIAFAAKGSASDS